MPELPDVTAYISALRPRITGQTLQRVRLASAFVLRTAEPPLADVAGRTVRDVRRIGKRIAIGLDGDLWLVLHLMIAGRLHWRAPDAKLAGRNALADDAALDRPLAGRNRRCISRRRHRVPARSRLLKADWPRALGELEALKQR